VAAARPGFVELDRVTLRYGRRGAGTLALEETSLAIGESEFAAIVGPSGCGKSTILKLVSGLIRPSSGTVTVAGREVVGPVKAMVGMAFQNPTMLPWLTVLNNVMIPLRIVEPYRSTWRAKRDEYEAKGVELLRTVGLKGFERKHTWELSGGMLQRASLCRALIHEPRMLLLDEPFGALDAFTREDLWAVLQSLWLEKRPTVILVTHDLREAVYLSDTVYVMSARPGRVLERRESPFARPRTLSATFGERFVEITHALRSRIGEAREAAAAEAA
jgi:NitT/TauT family transport system ATP-binding protein